MDEPDVPLVPVRMLNEFVYCPRLALLEWMDGEFLHSADTVEGELRHRRTDSPGFRRRRQEPPESPEAELQGGSGEILQLRAVELSDPELGLIAKIDLVELSGGAVQPVEIKKGKRPHVEHGAYDPERVQVCAQGLLLRSHGYRCDSGLLYFAGSHERVPVVFDDPLLALTLESLAQLREAARAQVLPPPLVDSPKCVRCSLAPICLPDELRFLRTQGEAPRPIAAREEHRFPVHVQTQGAFVRKDGDLLRIEDGDVVLGEVRLREVSQLVLMGRVGSTEATLRECLQQSIPVVHTSATGWLYGVTMGLPSRNVRLRQAQFRRADDPEGCLRIARSIVHAKILNQRTFLRRNAEDLDERVAIGLREAADAALRASSRDELLGVEGNAARTYFASLGALLRWPSGSAPAFDFEKRSRRPPRDPVNALLSFGYALLAREWVTACFSVGFDPFLGFFHTPHHGRPALALDLMESFRALVADSAVVRAINNGEVGPTDFVERMGYVNLTEAGRRAFIRALEARLSQEVTHPVFGYRASYRRIFEIEARLLARHLLGELPAYSPLRTR